LSKNWEKKFHDLSAKLLSLVELKFTWHNSLNLSEEKINNNIKTRISIYQLLSYYPHL
jgi:hypothetical protein